MRLEEQQAARYKQRWRVKSREFLILSIAKDSSINSRANRSHTYSYAMK